ncbi:DUF1360 domain-containing protein [Aliiroseovarius sp. YM-037]|uniref:DUF1360 domain-containing protein n=1 Tax=Aliiroseovarius sp. YM-037 TaxID=3341728 RepID=UPI003A7FCC83
MADWLIILLAVFAVWRVTHLIAKEDGPWNVVIYLRIAAGRSWVGHLMDCFKCLSLWVAIPFAFVIDAAWHMHVVLWLALSGAAILLEERSEEPILIEGEQKNGMLRRSESGDALVN